MTAPDDDVASTARSLLHSALDRVARQPPHTAPLTGSALSRYEGRAAVAEQFYRRSAGAVFVQQQPTAVVVDTWHGAHLWGLLDAGRFGALAERISGLIGSEHGVSTADLVRRHSLRDVPAVLAAKIEMVRDLSTHGEVWAHAPHIDAGPVDDEEDDEDDEDDDSAWGVSGPLDDLADQLGLHEHYPAQYGGGRMLYDQNVYAVGWKGDVPATVTAFLAARGQTDWVRFNPVPYSEDELLEAASTLMDRLDTARINCRAGGPNSDGTAAVVTFYDHPPGTRQRAEAVAATLSAQVGVPLEVTPTTEPRITAC